MIGFSIHFYLKFEQQRKVLEFGEIVKGKIVEISRKNKDGNKTYKVQVHNTTDYLDWGPKEWDKLKVGDEVKVKYLEGNSEIVQLTMNPKFGKYFSSFGIIIGVIIGIFSMIYKPTNKNTNRN
ncbi:hypothetical protein DF185_01330 [Marinifilum breve]|uniref:DUF3592 domain-containing protein n=2 Tax=Marinifilum breve TaxID=2184082 RepID=A0A2V4A349_9BACT|nr:hypothetical protein DF185_01330 [Marinifilum breve]